jgi:NADH-quinone oxidoreductase subunit L
MLTAWYMTRMTMLTFFGRQERWRSIKPAQHEHHAHAAHEHHAEHHGHDDAFEFFYTEDEIAKRQESEHEPPHHELDRNHQPHEVPPSMWVPLAVLAVLSLVGGYVMASHEAFRNWLYPEGKLAFLPPSVVPGETDKLPVLAMSIAAAALGLIVGGMIYAKGLPKKEGWDEGKWSPFRRLAGQQFGYDNAVVTAGVTGGGDFAKALWRYFDVAVIDGAVNGVGWLAQRVGSGLRLAQTGFVRTYAAWMLGGGVAIIASVIYIYMRIGGGK